MDKNQQKIIISLLVIIVILLAALLVMMPNLTKEKSPAEIAGNSSTNETADNSVPPDTITVELTEFDMKFIETAGEYTVEAEKWRGGTIGGFGVWLYKNGKLVNRDSYLSRAYYCMDGEWKWSEWGNGEGGAYHKYPVSNGVEIQKIEVKF